MCHLSCFQCGLGEDVEFFSSGVLKQVLNCVQTDFRGATGPKRARTEGTFLYASPMLYSLRLWLRLMFCFFLSVTVAVWVVSSYISLLESVLPFGKLVLLDCHL